MNWTIKITNSQGMLRRPHVASKKYCPLCVRDSNYPPAQIWRHHRGRGGGGKMILLGMTDDAGCPDVTLLPFSVRTLFRAVPTWSA